MIEPGDRVLVTGATGFVGSAVLRLLVARGAKVTVLARPASALANLEGVDCEIARGDMTDPVSMGAAMAGVRFVFHVAADYRLWARDPGEIMRANLEGARTVMEAAGAAGVEKIVYTSSVATLNAGRKAIDETAPLAEGEGIGVYKRSKVAAERLVERMAAAGLPVTIVLPSTPIGPRDIKPTPTGRILVEAAGGRIPAFLDTGLNLVHVDDVAAGHLMALERGSPGERYILGGQDASLRQLLAAIAALTGRRAPTLGLPRLPLYPLAFAAEAVARLTGREPMVTRDALDMAAHRMFFTSAKAERELGYHARPYQEALADALAWFRTAGYIR
ncbi:MAG TPA: hopanoid-associated sugar epimerase [Caulobacteraceae bacterium]|jgi:dihydroflavonol-4-reductase|nr:hopanoid-associated sugar epimerase [Caulobacteraceae bacterium]